MKKITTILIVLFVLVGGYGLFHRFVFSDERVDSLLKRFPEADLNNDGELTVTEGVSLVLQLYSKVVQNPAVFSPSQSELKVAISGGDALAFPKGKDGGLRLAMSGHSWVAPGVKTLPPLAKAAGYVDHHQVAHIAGGASGSANSIWLREFGKWREGVVADPILIPAISTGQWDVMTWGPYPKDKPVYYHQWIDFCLKKNPAMTFLIQGAWPRFKSGYQKMKTVEVVAAIMKEQSSAQLEMFLPMYKNLKEKHPGKVQVIPVSTAMMNLMQKFAAGKIPHMTCIDEAKRKGEIGFYRDGGHLSRSSGIEHLVGYGYFSMIYRRSPETVKGYSPKGVPPAFDKQMRKAIWKAVVASPMADIDDADGDGIAD